MVQHFWSKLLNRKKVLSVHFSFSFLAQTPLRQRLRLRLWHHNRGWLTHHHRNPHTLVADFRVFNTRKATKAFENPLVREDGVKIALTPIRKDQSHRSAGRYLIFHSFRGHQSRSGGTADQECFPSQQRSTANDAFLIRNVNAFIGESRLI